MIFWQKNIANYCYWVINLKVMVRFNEKKVEQTYIIASLFSTCLTRFCFSFKSHMAENYLDFCINRYLVWIIFSNIYNFERFTNYAVSTKVGPIFPKYTSEFISKIDQEDIRKFYQKLIWNVQDWFVFQTFNKNSSNTF